MGRLSTEQAFPENTFTALRTQSRNATERLHNPERFSLFRSARAGAVCCRMGIVGMATISENIEPGPRFDSRESILSAVSQFVSSHRTECRFVADPVFAPAELRA